MNATASLGMGGHQSAAMLKDEWLTPPEILKALGEFDLDPCCPSVPPWPIAKRFYTARHQCRMCDGTGIIQRADQELGECVFCDGLRQPWVGRVWCNPPYGTEAREWLAQCAVHGNAIALIFARTETEMFFDTVWDCADALLFIKGRLHFHHVNGERAKANAGAPSVLIAYGERNAVALQESGIAGKFIPL